MVSLLSVPWVLSQDGNQERSAQESAGKRQRSTKLVHKGINTEKGKLPVAPGEKLGLGLEGASGVEAVSRHATVEDFLAPAQCNYMLLHVWHASLAW